MTKQIGKGLTLETSIFRLESARPKILDLYMAPGGFTATAKAGLPGSLIHAVTLPPEVGGYEVMAKKACQNIIYGGITMYSKEMGYEENISTEHPDSENFDKLPAASWQSIRYSDLRGSSGYGPNQRVVPNRLRVTAIDGIAIGVRDESSKARGFSRLAPSPHRILGHSVHTSCFQ